MSEQTFEMARRMIVGTVEDVPIRGRALTAVEASAAAVADAVGVAAQISDVTSRPSLFWREQAVPCWVYPSTSGGASTTLRIHWGDAAKRSDARV